MGIEENEEEKSDEEQIKEYKQLIYNEKSNITEIVKNSSIYAKVILWIESKRLQGKSNEITASKLREELLRTYTSYANKLLTTLLYSNVLVKVDNWKPSMKSGRGLKANVYNVANDKLFSELVKIAKRTLE